MYHQRVSGQFWGSPPPWCQPPEGKSAQAASVVGQSDQLERLPGHRDCWRPEVLFMAGEPTVKPAGNGEHPGHKGNTAGR